MIAISLFIVLVIYVWIAFTTSRFIARKTQSQTAGIITAIAFLLLPSWDSIWGAVQFRYLCAAEGGFTIVKTARSQGFFDADGQYGCEVTCVEALTKLGFRFVEMDVSTPLWLTRSKGLHRFYLTDSGSPSCAEFDRYVSRQKGYISENVPKPKCVASESISSLSAQYDVAIAKTQGVITWPTKIERVESYVRDRQTGEMLAAGTSFRSWGTWLTRPLYFGPASVCPVWEDSHGQIEHVLTAE
jgi:hypothetical protein